MTPEKLLDRVRETDGLRVREEKTQQGSPDYSDEQHGLHTVTTQVVETYDGTILGGIDEHADSKTVKALVRHIHAATGIDLD